jgi:hypothetical protein
MIRFPIALVDPIGIYHHTSLPADSPAHAYQLARMHWPDAKRILVAVPSSPPPSPA